MGERRGTTEPLDGPPPLVFCKWPPDRISGKTQLTAKTSTLPSKKKKKKMGQGEGPSSLGAAGGAWGGVGGLPQKDQEGTGFRRECALLSLGQCKFLRKTGRKKTNKQKKKKKRVKRYGGGKPTSDGGEKAGSKGEGWS